MLFEKLRKGNSKHGGAYGILWWYSVGQFRQRPHFFQEILLISLVTKT
jgi:hypothetical protein